MPPTKEQLAVGGWNDLKSVGVQSFDCGYCGAHVASGQGWGATRRVPEDRLIRNCPNCQGPTLFFGDEPRVPGSSPGPNVPNLPAEVRTLYGEARDAAASGAYTGAVMICRTILASTAVQQGAEPGQSFNQYVGYLADNGFEPPNGRGWVEYIRTRGNDAIHDIILMTRSDAVAVIEFTGALLGFIYDFPRLSEPNTAGARRDVISPSSGKGKHFVETPKLTTEGLLASAIAFLLEGDDDEAADALAKCRVEQINHYRDMDRYRDVFDICMRAPRSVFDATRGDTEILNQNSSTGVTDFSGLVAQQNLAGRIRAAFESVVPYYETLNHVLVRAFVKDVDRETLDDLINQAFGRNINNQAPLAREVKRWKDLRFRSYSEVKIAEALEEAGVMFLPGCLARVTTGQHRATSGPSPVICEVNSDMVGSGRSPRDAPEAPHAQDQVCRLLDRGGARPVADAGRGGHRPGPDADPRPHPAQGQPGRGRPGLDRRGDRRGAGGPSDHGGPRAARSSSRPGLEAALERKRPDRVYARALDGAAEAHLVALACCAPPDGRERWTLRLLADELVRLEVVEAVSHETVRRTLKQTSSSRG